MEMDLLILQEAERESMEVFYAMRQELQFYLIRTLLLEKFRPVRLDWSNERREDAISPSNISF